ncbi:MarR family winged helix-turn-helix transcriptional regulator [Streptomyces sp. NPDC127068]|uniref:MarR family winged helix-turn-helix transcriptional regulator n=1 Tax=Streptomyces sp. NPDC127068 TaxID=3347127 RepID=UPI00364D52A0
MTVKSSEHPLVDRWREILTLHARTMCELDRELHRYGLGVSDFEVLDVLAEYEEQGRVGEHRVQEIAARVHLSQSALSRLIGRLERDGLVERGMCARDRRGVQVRLTPKGREAHAGALPAQRAVLGRTLREA